MSDSTSDDSALEYSTAFAIAKMYARSVYGKSVFRGSIYNGSAGLVDTIELWTWRVGVPGGRDIIWKRGDPLENIPAQIDTMAERLGLTSVNSVLKPPEDSVR